MQKGWLSLTDRVAPIRRNTQQLGITPTHIKHIESEHRKPSIDVLFHMISLLHLSIDTLFLPESPDAERSALTKEIDFMLTKCSERELSAIAAALRKLTAAD